MESESLIFTGLEIPRDYYLLMEDPIKASVLAARKEENVVRKQKKIYPNDPCPCGSGRKYKKCCYKNK